MSYPTTEDYGDVLSMPIGKRSINNNIPQLDEINRSRVIPGKYYLHRDAGQYAVVYHCTKSNGGSVAFRCLLQAPSSDIVLRCDKQREYLQRNPLPYVVHAGYFEQAIQVLGTWYPAFTMDWIEGETLYSRVNSLTSAGDRLGLKSIATRWEKMVVALQKAQVAHGDLHPLNVLVRPDGELRLVDYDSLFVPPLRGLATPIQGCEGYVHPCYLSGTSRQFDENMDNFGAALILLSLRALADEPSLFGRNTKDNLLLSGDDLNDPDHSPMFDRLERHTDTGISGLARALRQECRLPIETGTLSFGSAVAVKHDIVPDLAPEKRQFRRGITGL